MILLATTGLSLYVIFLTAAPSEAQQGATTGNRTANQNQPTTNQTGATRQTNQPTTNRTGTTNRAGNVVPGTTPKRPLPPSGGASLPVYGTVAAFVLAGAGLLGLGFGIGHRRS